MNDKKKNSWFDDLNEVEQKLIMAIKRESVANVGEPDEYGCVMDFFFDVHETYNFCIFK
tara:strand:+ start:540 stop:716 length:177 start_codon:yes stop_codon:yes gene_type:complete